MSDDRFTRIAQNLVKAACMSADELAAKKGEENPFVKIKRNSDRLNGCAGHDFEPDPGWCDAKRPLSPRTVHCRNCGGDMKTGDAVTYLRGYCHGAGKDLKAITSSIWPPAGTLT